jgi:hypothetical protein
MDSNTNFFYISIQFLINTERQFLINTDRQFLINTDRQFLIKSRFL